MWAHLTDLSGIHCILTLHHGGCVLRLNPWYCGSSQPRQVSHPHWRLYYRCKCGTRVFATFSLQLHPLRFFLSFWGSRVTFSSSKVTAGLLQYIPAFSFIFVSFCRVRNGVAFCYMLKHSGFHFFLTLSFKWFRFLNEAFELYQHGLFKNWT